MNRLIAKLPHRQRRKKSENQKAESTQLAISTQASASIQEVQHDSGEDGKPVVMTAPDSNEVDDMWTKADKKLRMDPQKREKLESYDRILEQQLGSKLKPIGTLERRKQVLDYVDSEIKRFKDADTETWMWKCSKRAKGFFENTVSCVLCVQNIINTAAMPCLPAAVACAGVTVLLSVSR